MRWIKGVEIILNGKTPLTVKDEEGNILYEFKVETKIKDMRKKIK